MKISIITVCYNSERVIADTLKSVAAQDCADIEHIVIDGGSRDRTMAIVEQHRHQRLIAISEADEGIYDAMNKGLALASGDYIGFLNSDDFLAEANVISLVRDHAQTSGADCIFGDTHFVDGDGVKRGGRRYSARSFRKWWLRVGAMPPHPSMFIRTELLRRLGGFDRSYRIAADFDMIARAILRHEASWTTLPVEVTRFRAGGVSTSGIGAKRAINQEMSRSLSSLGQPAAKLAVMLRLPLKMAQFRFFGSPVSPPFFRPDS